jgi:hypothetical protein
MKTLHPFLAILLVSVVARAEPPANPPMKKIVTRLESARIDPDSFAAKPKTLYLAGDTYARIELEPDTVRDDHRLVVISEPDMWVANLLDKTGTHQVDPGPTFVVHSNVLPPGAPTEFTSLEFGKEIEFFKAHKTNPATAREINGKRCNGVEYVYGDYRLVLLTAEDTGLPVQLEIYRDGRLNASIRYLSYELDLPFKAELFPPPAGITLTEVSAK